jgi:cysteine-rich repeat protein
MRLRRRWAAPVAWVFVLISCSRSELDPDLFGGPLGSTGASGASPGAGGASGAMTSTSAAETVGVGTTIGSGSTTVVGAGGSDTGDGGAAGSTGSAGAAGTGGAGGVMGSGSGGAMGSGGTIGAGGVTGAGGAAGAGGTAGAGAGGSSIGGAGGSSGRGGGAGSGGSAGSRSRCGDGRVDPGEECDLGAGNANRPALVVQQGAASHAVLPVSRAATANAFYNYFASSSHTGFEQVSTSHMMLYQDRNTGAMSLVVVLGIDEGTSGQLQPNGRVTMSFTGLPRRVAVALSDDAGELYLTSQTTAQGDWHFNRNGDGGILSGLPFPGTWSVIVTPAFMSGISSWQFSDDQASTSLTLDVPITISAFDSPSKCRTDCTVPTCGDGILDGGEVCDDGNRSNGDGCSSDCKSLF